uniref:Uncharacterized protein n=1 Tax=Cucumis melo TaxID=3656 RepID=A0A9I9EJA5_CUCME
MIRELGRKGYSFVNGILEHGKHKLLFSSFLSDYDEMMDWIELSSLFFWKLLFLVLFPVNPMHNAEIPPSI